MLKPEQDEEDMELSPAEKIHKLHHGFYYIQSPSGLFFHAHGSDRFQYGTKDCQKFLTEKEAQEALLEWAIKFHPDHSNSLSPTVEDYIKKGYTIKYADLDEARRLCRFLE